MTHAIVIRRAAAADIDEAHGWSESQCRGLGRDFLDEVDTCLARIADRPEAYPIIEHDARRALLHRFPYSVYFRIRGNDVRILAVVHQNRAPRTWQRRV